MALGGTAGWVCSAAACLAWASVAVAQVALAEPVGAGSLSPICTDRPTKANYACTVDAGHIQYEADVVNASFLKNDGATTDTVLVANPTLKYGVSSDLDVEASIAALDTVRTHVEGGPTRTLAGPGDLYLRLKYEWVNQGSSGLQASVIPYVKAPTARPGIGNGSVEGGAILPVNYIVGDVTLTTAPEVDVYENAGGGGHHVNTAQLVNVAFTLPRNFTLYEELWGDWNFDPSGTVRQYSFDSALTYGVTRYLQLDTGVNIGLNPQTPGVQAYVGVSQKFWRPGGARLPKPDDPRRPDPDALLAATRGGGRGELRVFLGMAPGVGKTYEMLSSAARRKADGADVVIGVVETHGRKETEALTVELETLARQPIDYRGRTLLEFDLDAALARRPGLLLVDEYAHSNAPGSRHPKRWQDVAELLAAGIDVWTTLNVQHLESLVDVVWRITGVRVRETVPDSALSAAHEIELIDLTPDELRERMAAGKVYVPETARLASDRFFKVENLTALREMALRRAAQTVDDKLVGQMRAQGIEGPWAAGERILVLVGSEPFGAALVRAGRRLSDLMMDAPWTVLHVERPNRPPPPDAALHTASALKLAEQLGGRVVTLSADDLLSSVLQYAARNNMTQIVVGRAGRAPGWRDRARVLFGRSLAHTLMEQTRGAALHVVTDTGADDGSGPVERPARADPTRRRWRGYAAALCLVVLAGGIAAAVDRYMANANLAMIFLGSVLVSGAAFGFGPGLVAAASAAVAYNFFFLAPRLSFVIGHSADLITFAVFFAVAVTTGLLTGRVRDQARTTARRASVVASLLAASRRLSAVSTREDAAQALAEQASGTAGATAVVLLPEDGDVRLAAHSPKEPALSTSAMTAARWAWEKGEPAGHGTGTLPQIDWTFWPLQGLRARSGVAGVSARRDGGGEAGEERLLLALLDQGAVALERAELASATVSAETLRRSDQLRAALLNSISHDLRTPLSTVLGSATTLLDYGGTLRPEVYRDLLESIREDAHRLNRYVGDLLDMTRLEGGALDPRREWTDVRDVLAAAIERVERRLGGRRLVRDFPADLSLVKTDPGLLEQAVVNILENAIAYSPDDTAIEVAAYEDRGNVAISIEDEGKGIPTEELERVFDKFRRLDQPSDRGKGIGLGLSISKGFVEALGGRIAAASPIREDAASGLRGTRVLISLRKDVQTHHGIL